MAHEMLVDPEALCAELLTLDSAIRFVGITNKMGRLVASKFRQGLQQLLTSEELESNALKAALRMKTREDYELRLGRIIYTFALYDKVKRASIALDDSHYSLLLVSFDTNADHEPIILNKLLPRIRQHHLITEA